MNHEDHEFTGTCSLCGQPYCGREIERLRALVRGARLAIEGIIEAAESHWDEGPIGEGWQSGGLEEGCAKARDFLAASDGAS